ncbi:hypothetical protein PIG00_002644 [Enterococcus faecalis]|nr:hypothetical protein [Enterococcus faecalis]
MNVEVNEQKFEENSIVKEAPDTESNTEPNEIKKMEWGGILIKYFMGNRKQNLFAFTLLNSILQFDMDICLWNKGK